MKTYKQLTEGQRYQIAALKEAGNTNKAIAEIIRASESTISREIRRNGDKHGYCPQQAHDKACHRRRTASKAIKVSAELIALVNERIHLEWSPEQISGWLLKQQGSRLSHAWIYQHIAADKRRGGILYSYLRQGHKQRRKKYGSTDNRGQICNRVSIDQRPDIVDKKTRIGDWEIDTVIGQNHKGALVTLVERNTKYTLIKKVDSKHAEGVTAATITLLKPYSDKVFTITADNGKEFAGHETIAKQLDAQVYFAHPYASWERGLNENTNGLIRQYLPKGSSFETITDEEIAFAMHRLNNRPRKGLDYQTPHELFLGQHERKAA